MRRCCEEEEEQEEVEEQAAGVKWETKVTVLLKNRNGG